jgi:hypothetical protein
MALSDHLMDPVVAGELTKNYRDANPGSIIGGYFSRDCFEAILAQPGCAGIRYYFGIKVNGEPCIVLTGVDANNNDQYLGVVIEMSLPCPNMCSTPNCLNSNTPL